MSVTNTYNKILLVQKKKKSVDHNCWLRLRLQLNKHLIITNTKKNMEPHQLYWEDINWSEETQVLFVFSIIQ